MINSGTGPQVDTEKAISHIDLQYHAESLLGGDPPAADPNPGPNPAPADPPKPEPAPADPPKQADPEPKPGDPPPKEPEKKEPEKKDPEKKEPEKPEGAPERYEFTVPEGLTFNEANTAKVTGLFKELNLTNEQAQKLINAEGEYLNDIQTANVEAFENFKADLKDQTLKKYGAAWDTEKVYAAKFIDQIGGPELGKQVREFLENDPIGQAVGSHPLFTELFITAGKRLAEDKLEEGAKTHTKSDKELLEEHYAKSYGKK